MTDFPVQEAASRDAAVMPPRTVGKYHIHIVTAYDARSIPAQVKTRDSVLKDIEVVINIRII